MNLAKGTAMTKPTRSQISQSFGKLDDIVKQGMNQTGVPGISLAVVFDDQVLYQQGYGFCCTETSACVKPETVFQIASLSKLVSATIMAGLVGGDHVPKCNLHLHCEEIE